jgi:DnaJ-class molecular chaperone
MTYSVSLVISLEAVLVVSEEAVAEVFVALKEVISDQSKLTLEVANGVEKKVKVKRKVQAPGVSYKTCSTCNGQGQVMRTNTI